MRSPSTYAKNIATPGPKPALEPCDYQLLPLESQAALNVRKATRWYATLLDGKFRMTPLNSPRTTPASAAATRRMTRTESSLDPAALTEFTTYLPECEKNPFLRKLLHEAGRPISFFTDPQSSKSTVKPVQPTSKSTHRSSSYAPRIDLLPPPMDPRPHPSGSGTNSSSCRPTSGTTGPHAQYYQPPHHNRHCGTR